MIIRDVEKFKEELKENMSDFLIESVTAAVCETKEDYNNGYLEYADFLIVRKVNKKEENDIFIKIEKSTKLIWIGECNEENDMYRIEGCVFYEYWKKEIVMMSIGYNVAKILMRDKT